MTQESGEKLKSSVMPVNDFLTDHLASGLEPIGGVIFADKSRLTMVGADSEHILHASSFELDPYFNRDHFIGGRGRLVGLEVDDVRVAQVVLTSSFSVDRFNSVRSRPSVAAKFSYQDLVSDKPGQLALSEKDLLEFVTGDNRLAIFEGGGVKESNALVFQQQAADLRTALVFFLYPTETETADSYDGVYTFFDQVNQAFRGLSGVVPMQDQALEAFEKDLQKGLINFEPHEGVRQEIIRAMIIAHARLWEIDKQASHIKFLEAHLPGMRRGLRAWSKRTLPSQQVGLREEVKEEVEKSINGFIMTEPAPSAEKTASLVPALSHEKLKEIEALGLKTTEARVMRTVIASTYGEPNVAMEGYLKSVLSLVVAAASDDEFADAEALVRELHDHPSQFYRRNLHYGFDIGITAENPKSMLNSPKIFYELGSKSGTKPISIFIDAMMEELQRRKRITLEAAQSNPNLWKSGKSE